MKYRKKPVVVEAMQWYDTREDTKIAEIFIDKELYINRDALQISDNLEALEGYWLIKYQDGRIEVMSPKEFDQTYEKVEE